MSRLAVNPSTILGRAIRLSQHSAQRRLSSTITASSRPRNKNILITLGLTLGGATILSQTPYTRTDSLKTPLDASNSIEEPITKLPVPKTLTQTYGQPPKRLTLSLIGLGVRQVTFINFNAYTIGFYLSPTTCSRIQKSFKWRSDFSAKHLLDGDQQGEYFVRDLVRGEGEVAIRIDPTRNTDGPHLRNGFMRFLTARLAKEDDELSEVEKTAILEAFDSLRAKFPAGRVAPGQAFVFTKTQDGGLRVEFEGEEFVTVNNRWVAERFFEGYLTAEKPISEKLRRSIAEGLETLARAT
ncbi:hypothetical protein HK097_009425 [Rhizophlyctis rosea]|uniref:Chalcone isomerase domain-containing protein n=1 Tax=Rhizophlyctis rosea TaxID=64517 RepID=A0AAD5SBB6_9FUNG|nr:hypothetical protein HK097_009425 [Rhizophlyctis rosea]